MRRRGAFSENKSGQVHVTMAAPGNRRAAIVTCLILGYDK